MVTAVDIWEYFVRCVVQTPQTKYTMSSTSPIDVDREEVIDLDEVIDVDAVDAPAEGVRW